MAEPIAGIAAATARPTATTAAFVVPTDLAIEPVILDPRPAAPPITSPNDSTRWRPIPLPRRRTSLSSPPMVTLVFRDSLVKDSLKDFPAAVPALSASADTREEKRFLVRPSAPTLKLFENRLAAAVPTSFASFSTWDRLKRSVFLAKTPEDFFRKLRAKESPALFPASWPALVTRRRS